MNPRNFQNQAQSEYQIFLKNILMKIVGEKKKSIENKIITDDRWLGQSRPLWNEILYKRPSGGPTICREIFEIDPNLKNPDH